uniref:Uncharacterized protein n=1 Tax=Aegilops tauschii subsp. strangulata TaxID=200361 RepID=A0A452YMK6_AEGTS
SRPLSGWAVRVGEGQSLVLKTSILKIKESGGKRGELPVPGSPVTGFPGTTRILRMGFQLSTFCFEILRRVALFGEHIRSMISHSWTLIRSFHLVAP